MPDQNLSSQFLLDPTIIFLNHGSFGACPKPVFQQYQNWQRMLEEQPVLFLGRQYNDLIRQAIESLGEFLGTSPANLVFVPNATYGVNLIARSLNLQPGDEILTSDHVWCLRLHLGIPLLKKWCHLYTPTSPLPYPLK